MNTLFVGFCSLVFITAFSGSSQAAERIRNKNSESRVEKALFSAKTKGVVIAPALSSSGSQNTDPGFQLLRRSGKVFLSFVAKTKPIQLAVDKPFIVEIRSQDSSLIEPSLITEAQWSPKTNEVEIKVKGARPQQPISLTATAVFTGCDSQKACARKRSISQLSFTF